VSSVYISIMYNVNGLAREEDEIGKEK